MQIESRRPAASFFACCAAFVCFVPLAAAQPLAANSSSSNSEQAGPNAPDLSRQALVCTACHGKQGRAGSDGYYPRLAGKPRTYLFNQLRAFRDARRHYAPMKRLLAPLNDDYLYRLAGYFAALSVPYASPQKPAADIGELTLGRTLALDGMPPRIAACTSCHGDQLAGGGPAIPGLLGLPRDYLNAQLGAWREGQRSMRSPDCMRELARALSPAEVRALSNWLAAQSVSGPLQPSGSAPTEAALKCGPVVAAHEVNAAFERELPATESVRRGRYLARLGNCESCHSKPGSPSWTGGRAIETPFGLVYSSNLTPATPDGLGNWSRDAFRRAMREGISRDGHLLYPAFPYESFSLMRDEDIDAVFDFLRSLDPVTARPVDHQLRFPYSMQWALAWWRRLFFRPSRFEPDPNRDALWNRGAYLVNGIAHCSQCHGSRNFLGALAEPKGDDGAYLPGGWWAPGLAGLAGAYTSDELLRLLKQGQSSRSWVAGPMRAVVTGGTAHLSAADAEAVVRYLSSLASSGATQSTSAGTEMRFGTAAFANGKALYETHCADCHQSDGRGRDAEAPALRANPSILAANASNIILSVLDGGFGAQTPENASPHGMPPFAQLLSDVEIARLIGYLRSAWGNRASAVRHTDVAAMRDRR